MSAKRQHIVLCEGFDDRSFWTGWLLHLGCDDPSQGGRTTAYDKWGHPIRGRGRFAFTTAAGRRGDFFEKVARPDQLTSDPRTPKNARNSRAFPNALKSKLLYAPRLDDARAAPHHFLVDQPANSRADRLPDGRPGQAQNCATKRATDRRANG